MAKGHNDDEKDLPITWPFTFAALCLLVALAWFCVGWAIRDRKQPEPAVVEGPTRLADHFPVFWTLLIIGAVSIAVGIVYNMTRDSRRK